MKLLKYLANLGYGSRREVEAMLGDGRVTDSEGTELDVGSRFEHAQLRVDGEALDPAPGCLMMLHKPVGYTCSTKDSGRLIYDLLPYRLRARKPVVSPVGRLDRDTSGLLLLTDDGGLLHRIISPKAKISKVYEAELAQDLRGDEGEIFASGGLLLESDDTPLLPAGFAQLGPRRARLTLHEGRYHQVRRMFAAVGNHVEALHRSRVGGLDLDGLPAGDWRLLEAADRERLFAATLE
jgi:16S rRNA pseudouridine516 synthase